MSEPARATAEDAADLGAVPARAAIAEGRLTPAVLAEACLARIAALEPDVQAWTVLDPERVRRQALALGRCDGTTRPLLGLPVGVKDIFATADMPTENGTHLHAGRQPAADAAVVARLRAAGALVMGKTVTTELAAFTPGKTRNPRDQRRTPGGSSSGSAAAVASGMVPLALGSQTNGSVIRPASFCGIYGFKPSFGLIDREGMTAQAPSVDHVGCFARSLADIALVADVLAGPSGSLRGALGQRRDAAPRLAFVKGPSWDAAEAATQQRFTSLATELGLPTVELPAMFDEAIEVHRRLTWPELAHLFRWEYDQGHGGLSEALRAMVAGGREIAATDYLAAIDARARLREAIGPLLDRFDALVTPPATGEAPIGLESTGSPVFCTVWTLLGTPAISLPLLQGPAGMPLGVQLVSGRGRDASLLAAAAWLEARLGPG
jgi:Asp-tRNA(Asn)/Glu-tRNA(Gln) amidotransferase A subunit family amidase